MTVLMVDGTTGDVPAILRRFGTSVPVAGYVTGPGIEWTERQFSMFARKIRVAQSPVPLYDDDSPARCLDVERYAASPRHWPDFYNTRADKDGATCYCSLDTVPEVLGECQAASIPPPPRWWLAWYWGRPGAPTVRDVLDELVRISSTVLDPQTVWAVQYANFPQWDLSAVYGAPDFSRR